MFRRLLAPACLLTLMFGCSVSDADSSAAAAAEDDREPIGKADLIGSCEDACDGPAPEGNCWCDDFCSEIGDCCADKVAVCGGEGNPGGESGGESGGSGGEGEPALCLGPDDCDIGEFCDESECLSDCEPGETCTELCFGQCVELNDTVLCVPGEIGICGDEQYCKVDDGSCGESGGLGICTDVNPAPACTKELDLQCGCDGNTYGNPCLAEAAGANIEHAGPCPAACDDETPCEGEGTYCLRDEGCDGPGVCAALETKCNKLFAPTCGCDGETYGNECMAGASGINVDHPGFCE